MRLKSILLFVGLAVVLGRQEVGISLEMATRCLTVVKACTLLSPGSGDLVRDGNGIDIGKHKHVAAVAREWGSR